MPLELELIKESNDGSFPKDREIVSKERGCLMNLPLEGRVTVKAI